MSDVSPDTAGTISYWRLKKNLSYTWTAPYALIRVEKERLTFKSYDVSRLFTCLGYHVEKVSIVIVITKTLDPGGGGDSHMKVTGMLVVSLRVVNWRFWSRLGFLGRKANFLPIQVSLRVRVKKYLHEKTKRLQSLASIFSTFKITEALIWLSVLAWSRLGVK